VDSIESTSSGKVPPLETQGSAYKSWVASSIKKSASLALSASLSNKMKSMMYGKKQDPTALMSSHESIDSVGMSTPDKR